MLPNAELAAIAEKLIDMTILKQKLSMKTETVGGPVDVAIISIQNCGVKSFIISFFNKVTSVTGRRGRASIIQVRTSYTSYIM